LRPYAKRGKRAFELEEYKDAVNLFGQAHELAPQNAEYLTWLGYARYEQVKQANQENETQKTVAKVELRNALALEPGNAETSLILGKVYLDENKTKLAAEQFDNALLQWPDNLEALRAYHRIHSMRRREIPVKNEQSLANEQVRLYYQLSRSLDELEKQDVFSMLHVPDDADDEEIKRAYEERNAGVMIAVNPQQNGCGSSFSDRGDTLPTGLRLSRVGRRPLAVLLSASLFSGNHPGGFTSNEESSLVDEPAANDKEYLATSKAANDQPAFWQRLRGRLKRKKPVKSACYCSGLIFTNQYPKVADHIGEAQGKQYFQKSHQARIQGAGIGEKKNKPVKVNTVAKKRTSTCKELRFDFSSRVDFCVKNKTFTKFC
jgi:tetratricopeptide (TPR) repeat protein